MTLKEARKRIEQLEQRVKMLEARPAQEIHYHYWYNVPYVPYTPYPLGPTWTCPQTVSPWIYSSGSQTTVSTSNVLFDPAVPMSNGIQWSA